MPALYSFGQGFAQGFINQKAAEQEQESKDRDRRLDHKNAIDLVNTRVSAQEQAAKAKRDAARRRGANFFMQNSGFINVLDQQQQQEIIDGFSLLDDNSLKLFNTAGLKGNLDLSRFRQQIEQGDTLTLPGIIDPTKTKVTQAGQQNLFVNQLPGAFGIDEKFINRTPEGTTINIPLGETTRPGLRVKVEQFKALGTTFLDGGNSGLMAYAKSQAFFPQRIDGVENESQFQQRKAMLDAGRGNEVLARILRGLPLEEIEAANPGTITRRDRIDLSNAEESSRTQERQIQTEEVAKEVLDSIYNFGGVLDISPSAREIIEAPQKLFTDQTTGEQVEGDDTDELARQTVDLINNQGEQAARDFLLTLPEEVRQAVVLRLRAIGGEE